MKNPSGPGVCGCCCYTVAFGMGSWFPYLKNQGVSSTSPQLESRPDPLQQLYHMYKVPASSSSILNLQRQYSSCSCINMLCQVCLFFFPLLIYTWGRYKGNKSRFPPFVSIWEWKRRLHKAHEGSSLPSKCLRGDFMAQILYARRTLS